MKMLDEVIEIYERVVKHDYVWFDEKTALMTIETLTDTLQYLKEYQWQMTDPDGDHQRLEKCRTLLQDFYRNDPLSWDELKQMEGRPIWIELLGNGHWKGWDVVGGFTDDDFGDVMVTVRGDDYYKADLGKMWRAYRKEQEKIYGEA